MLDYLYKTGEFVSILTDLGYDILMVVDNVANGMSMLNGKLLVDAGDKMFRLSLVVVGLLMF